ncbi:MAG: riboflavin synthase [Balneolaceae bacterium]|nr:riboflavin synthase [Balneolaceae bacterium]
MFTGIIEELGTINKITEMDGAKELSIEAPFVSEVHVDESIAVNGVCLTVVSFDEKSFNVQCVNETLRKTNLGDLIKGDPVNLERSLTLEKAIEGHIVQGHVDTVGTVTKVDEKGADKLLTFTFPKEYTDYIVGRGSIAIDGISMTVARESENSCTVAVIPYTWENTNFKIRKAGDHMNLEFDIFGKYILKYLKSREEG